MSRHTAAPLPSSDRRMPAWSGRLRRTALAASAVPLLLVATAGAAAADTSTASASAASVTLLGGGILTSGTASADNAGSPPSITTSQTPALSTLGAQGVITSGVLAQRAVAAADGTSAACSGLLGSGGSITIGPDGRCTPTIVTTGGVILTLTTLVKIKADAIIASCTASSDGTVTASTQLVNAAVYTSTLLPPTTTKSALDSSPVANTGLTIAGIATLATNSQTTPAPGAVTARGLDVTLLGSTAAVRIAAVSCGGNVKVMPTPAIPLEGMPLALAGVAVAVAVAGRRNRRRIAALVSGR